MEKWKLRLIEFKHVGKKFKKGGINKKTNKLRGSAWWRRHEKEEKERRERVTDRMKERSTGREGGGT